MARYNEILAGRFNKALTKVLSMKGEAPAPQLASDIQPSLVFQAGSEVRFLEGWDMFGAGDDQAAQAAAIAGFRFRNPVGSNVIMVFQKIFFSSAAADLVLVDIGQTVADLTNNINQTTIDSRSRPKTTAKCTRSGAASPATIGVVLYTLRVGTAPTNLIDDGIQEIMLLPGDGLQIRGTTINIGMTLYANWRERSLEESELK